MHTLATVWQAGPTAGGWWLEVPGYAGDPAGELAVAAQRGAQFLGVGALALPLLPPGLLAGARGLGEPVGCCGREAVGLRPGAARVVDELSLDRGPVAVRRGRRRRGTVVRGCRGRPGGRQ